MQERKEIFTAKSWEIIKKKKKPDVETWIWALSYARGRCTFSLSRADSLEILQSFGNLESLQ